MLRIFTFQNRGKNLLCSSRISGVIVNFRKSIKQVYVSVHRILSQYLITLKYKKMYIKKKQILRISTFQNGEKNLSCSSGISEVVINFFQSREWVHVTAYQI